jgi:hypothetical protein
MTHPTQDAVDFLVRQHGRRLLETGEYGASTPYAVGAMAILENDSLKAQIAEIEAQQVAVVKPLVWVPSDKHSDYYMCAASDCGAYEYEVGECDFGWLFVEHVRNHEGSDHFRTPDAAKAAAQAHHNTCYLSATTLKSEVKVRSDAINEFTANLGLNLSEAVKHLPDDVRLLRMKSAIAEKGKS